MPKDILDLNRVRRNFDRMREPVPENLPDRFADVRQPLDPYVAARDALDRLRRGSLDAFPERESALLPFLERAAGLVERLAKPGESEDDDPAELKEDLIDTVEKLEDLCEAFAQRGRT